MAYIGNSSPSRFVSNRTKTAFSGNGSLVDFTLEQAVVQPEDVLVSVDGVIQEPTVAYGIINGTTLRFTEAPSSNAGNNIFVYYLASQVGTAGPPNDSVSTDTLKNSAVTNAKVANSTLDLTSKVTGVLPVANGGTGLASNPLFLARGADNIAMANNTWVKVTFNSEVYDVGGYYDPTTNYRYTPQVAGKYLIYGRVYITYGSDAIDGVRIAIYKNGSNVAEMNRYSTASTTDIHGSVQVQSIIDMNGSSDYLEIYARHNISADGVYYASGAYGEFSGYRIGA